MTFFKNKILKLAPELNGQWIDGTYIYKEGECMYNRYLKSYAGVDKNTGKALWYMDREDEAGHVLVKDTVTDVYTKASSYATGDILPKVYGGFGSELKVYGVDLSVAFNYQAGGRIFDTGYQRLMHAGSSSDAGHNWHMDILKAWTPENKDSNIPALNAGESNANGTSDRWLISSNYVSLQNITLGYTFPAKLTKKAHIEKIRLYAVADNVALWSARKGLDPRQSNTSSNSTYYSPMRSFSGGVSITF
jgi:hypothetical protein